MNTPTGKLTPKKEVHYLSFEQAKDGLNTLLQKELHILNQSGKILSLVLDNKSLDLYTTLNQLENTVRFEQWQSQGTDNPVKQTVSFPVKKGNDLFDLIKCDGKEMVLDRNIQEELHFKENEITILPEMQPNVLYPIDHQGPYLFELYKTSEKVNLIGRVKKLVTQFTLYIRVGTERRVIGEMKAKTYFPLGIRMEMDDFLKDKSMTFSFKTITQA